MATPAGIYQAWFNRHSKCVNFDGLEEFTAEWHNRFFNAPFDRVMTERAATAMYRDVFGRPDPNVVILKSPREIQKYLVDMCRRSPHADTPQPPPTMTVKEHLSFYMTKFLFGKHGLPEGTNIMVSDVEQSNVTALNMLTNYRKNFNEIVPDSIGEDMNDSTTRDTVLIAHRSAAEACMAAFYIDRGDRESIYRHAAWLMEQSAYFLTFDDRIIICEKPTHISGAMRTNRHLRGQAVNDDRPLLQYSDGFTVFTTRGIIIPSKYLECKPEEIDINEVLALEDVDLRAELIRRIGPKNFLERGGGTVVDAGNHHDPNGYQVVELNFGQANRHPYRNTGARRLYLKMKNPSVEGIYHFEGVPGRCSVCGLDRESFVACPFLSVKIDKEGNVFGTSMFKNDRGCDQVKKALYFRNRINQKPKVIV